MFLTPKELQEAKDSLLKPIFDDVCQEISEMMMNSEITPEGVIHLTIPSKVMPVKHLVTKALIEKGWVVQWQAGHHTLSLTPKAPATGNFRP